MARLTGPDIQITDGTDPLPVASGNVYFSEPGTTTEKTIYSDSALTTPISQPVTLNSEGRFSTDIYGDGAFRVECYDSTDTGSRDGVQVFDVDNVRGPSDLSSITATSQIFADDSTSTALPVYSFDGDGDTGIAHPAADTIAGVTGGTERWRTNSSGNTGFGTTSPTERLQSGGNIKAANAFFTRSGTTSSIPASGSEALFTGENASIYVVTALNDNNNGDFRAVYWVVFGVNAATDNVTSVAVLNGNLTIQSSGTTREIEVTNTSGSAATIRWKAMRVL